MQNPQLADRYAVSTSTSHKVAVAWVRGKPARGANFRTDGRTVWSYDHVVGTTSPDGAKVAVACSASMTTRKQTGPMLALADSRVTCPEHPEATAPRQYQG